MLSEKPMSFSRMLEELGVSSSNLTYHLESLGELLSKNEKGDYKLSTFGEASVNTMRIVEEAPAVRSTQRWSLSLRWKTLFVALLVGVVVFAGISIVQLNSLNQLSSDHQALESKYNQLLSWSAGTDDALRFLRDVVQVDVSHYDATLLSNSVESRADLGGVIEQILRYSLTSSDSKFDVVFRFRNNQLSRYQVILVEGSPIYSTAQPYDVLGSATGVLQRLASYEDASYLANMSRVLASLNTAENAEITDGNTKLNVSLSGSEAEVLWLYTENGVEFSPKSLSLIYEDGVLKELTDGWFLFKIGSTQVQVTNEQAIGIARNAAQGFTWTADGQVVSTFTIMDKPVSAIFHPTQRDQPLTLEPFWQVTLYLDKTYPDGVNRLIVGIWADTGKVRDIKTSSG
jgi:hypothetical protein